MSEELPQQRSWYRVIEESEKIAHMTLPRHGGLPLRFYTDVGKRLAICQHCNLPIPKGTKRAVFAMLRRQAFKFRNGGVSVYQKCFVHPHCVEEVLAGGPHTPVGNLCVDCGQPVGTYQCRVQVGNLGYSWGRVCHDCSTSKRYALCTMCEVLVPKQRTSLRVGSTDIDHLNPGDINIVCDTCANSFDVLTLKQIKRTQNAEKQLDDRMQKAIGQIEDWFSNRST